MKKTLSPHRSYGFTVRMISLMLMLVIAVFSNPAVSAVTTDYVNWLTEQTFTLTPEEGVTVTLSGELPCKGSAEAVAAQVEGDDILHAYDITIFYADGREYEPFENKPVSVSFKSEKIAMAVEKDRELSAEHILDSGSTELIDLTLSQDNEASFTAESFSVYVIKSHETDDSVQTPRKTFRFLSNNFADYECTDDEDNPLTGYYVSDLYEFPNKANEMVSYQILKNEEKLQPVVIPPNFDWGHFYGWYIVELDLEKSKAATAAATGTDAALIDEDDLTRYVYKWTDEPVGIDYTQPVEVTKDENVYLAPLYTNYRFLNFHAEEIEDPEDHDHEDSACHIIARKLIVLGGGGQCSIDISDVVADSPDPQSEVFFGWMFKNETYQTRLSTGDIVHKSITVTSDDINAQVGQGDADDLFSLDIYPVFKEARWVTFVAGESDWNTEYVNAMFAFLYDTSVPEAQRVSISQLPSTTRPGYIFDGWYTGRLEKGSDGKDHIVYDQQVSMGFDEEGATGNSQIISTEGERIYITGGEDGNIAEHTYLFKGRLYLKEALTLYAKWVPLDHADYKVVVWKQRVTDSKNAADSEKQYDYYNYKMMENYPTGTIILDSEDFNDLGWESLTSSTNSEIKDAFNFFHYSRTTVEVGGNTYNGKNPSERVKGVVAPDGSTVVNIYYDRDLMAINFYYTSNAPAGAVSAFTYTQTDAVNTSTTYYGLTPNGYQALTRYETPSDYYTYRFRYSPTSDHNQNNMFGIVNYEFVPLTSRSIYIWIPQTVYTPVDKNTYTSDGYAFYNGSYVPAYYNSDDHKWYRTRTRRIIPWGYEYSNEVTGDVYSRGTGTEPYTGTRYTRSGNRYYETTSNNGTQYMRDPNGVYFQLTRDNGYAYTYNNVEYNGQLYTRTDNTDYSLEYKGTRYKKVNGEMVALGSDESYTGTIYGIDEDSYYEELTRRDEPTYTWKIGDEVYTGPRYTRSSKTGSMLTWTGLFGQTFAQNEYTWSTVNNYSWSGVGADGKTTTQTLLDGFTEAVNPYNLEQGSSSGNNTIYHYKQQLDGKYTESDRYTAYYSGNSVNFTFTNKFDSFTVAGYSSSFNQNFNPDQPGSGEHKVGPDGSASLSGTIHIYHTRKKFTLTLANFRTANNSPNQPNDEEIEDIYFEQPLSFLTQSQLTPPDRENYTFGGWYYDKAFTKAVDFSKATMPDGELTLFAKWVLKYYFVEIDPAGGEMEDALEFSEYTGFDSPRNQPTYTWLQFGSKLSPYDNVERKYIPDNNGEYMYVNVKFAQDFETASTKIRDYSLPPQYRAAFYCKGSELQQIYDDHFSSLVDNNGEQLITWDFFKDYCVDTTVMYRPVRDQESYVLAAWYKVNDDGTTSNDIYNFGDTVTKPTRIRAVWRKAGEYSIEYDPYMRRYDVGEYVMEDGVTYNNEKYYDPHITAPEQTLSKYQDEAVIKIHSQPDHIPEGYIFRGWQLLDSDLRETGIYYAVGVDFTIDSKYADHDGVIHFEAAYEPEKESARRVDIAALTLDANSERYGGYVVKNGLDVYPDYTYVDPDANQLYFTKQPNNFKVELQKYYNNFRNRNGYMLIGWDDKPTADNFIPKYPADAVIGVDSKNMEGNVLYAIWEPMYYLTLENHSTEHDVTFDLEFDDYDSVVYSHDTNEVVSVFERKIFSTHSVEGKISVTENSVGNFTVTLNKAASGAPANGVKLVLPQGSLASYTVSGTIENTSIASSGKPLTVFNSGGADVQATSQNPNFSVNGDMVHSDEGQTVAFYTEAPPNTKISLKASYYDPDSGWTIEDNPADNVGPNATLNFFDLPEGVVESDNSIQLFIFDESHKTFSVRETYTNTDKYKFIGWYGKNGATPRDISLDNKEFGDAEVTGLTVTNDPEKVYYALYVPYSDGTLTLSHTESQTSIGYPKKLSVEAWIGDDPSTSERDEITTSINVEHAVDHDHQKVHTEIQFDNFREPRTPAEGRTAFNIDLEAMSGYGCVHYNTYEEGRALTGRIVDDNTVINVYMDPSYTDDNHPEGAPVETKHYYEYKLNRTVSDMFDDSENVKGYRTIKIINFYSDFERKYEFVYTYKFRDGTTRKYQVKDATAYLKSEADFKQFVFESAPYISNFGEEVVWKPDTIVVNNLGGKGQITATMEAFQTKAATAYVTVKRFDASIPWPIDVGTAFPEDNRPTADLIINNKQFSRWEIKETDTGKLIGYCYNPEFTFVVWSNYTITPEYVDMEDDEYVYIPPVEDTSYVTLDYLDSTRNQWVGLDENGNIIVDAKGVATEHYDSLISDFSILFVDKGNRINTDTENYKLGLIYEVVGTVDNTNIPDQYTVTPNDELRARAINAVVNSTAESGSIKSQGQTKFYYSKIDPSSLSDANRIEYYRGISNLLSETGDLNPNATNVFNVYAYMVLSDGTIVQSDPITLQLYNLATKTVTG